MPKTASPNPPPPYTPNPANLQNQAAPPEVPLNKANKAVNPAYLSHINMAREALEKVVAKPPAPGLVIQILLTGDRMEVKAEETTMREKRVY